MKQERQSKMKKIKTKIGSLLTKPKKTNKAERIKLSGDHSNYHGGSAAAFNVIRKEAERYGKVIEEEDYDLLIVNGEGSMNHSSGGFKKKMSQIKNALDNKKRVMLVNTVWQDNSQEHADILSRCDQVITREVLSQKELAQQGISSKIFIDQSYHEEIDESAPFMDYKGDIVFTDFWSSEFECPVKLTSKWAQKHYYLDMQNMSWSSTVKSLRTASLLVTGRHHAVYAACKSETPFIAMKGNTHKIEGLIETSGLSIPIHSCFNDVKKLIKEKHIPKNECDALFRWMKTQSPWRIDS